MLQIVPGIRIAAPRDALTLREELGEAVGIKDGPSVVRFPKGNVVESIPALRRMGDGVDILREDASRDVLLVAVGAMATLALDVAKRLDDAGIGSTVIDPRWVIPVASSIVDFARDHRIVVSIEDGIRVGGVGTRIRQELRHAGVDTGVDELGLPDEFLEHDTRGNILARVGLTSDAIAAKIINQLSGTVVPKGKPKRR
jgi:1-deoxy-D-xylulose-5-phosphate synthase